MSQDEERAAMRAAVETGAVSVGEYVAKYGSEPTPNDAPEIDLTQFDGHTPSWKAGQRRDGSWWLSTGEVSSGPHAQFDIHVLRDQDARLIAAAPDLLAAYKAALARAEAAERRADMAEKERDVLSDNMRQMARQLSELGQELEALAAEAQEEQHAAERQRDEAIAASTARAEAMREACAQASEGEAYGFPPEQLTEHGQGYDRACKEIAAILRALPIPAQGGK